MADKGVRVELHVVGWRDFRPWHARSGDTRGSLAWSRREVLDDDQVVGHITVRRGADRILWGLQRLGHELEHVLDPAFRNATHHPLGHQCLRSYSFRRTWKHAEKATPELADQLRKQGWLQVDFQGA